MERPGEGWGTASKGRYDGICRSSACMRQDFGKSQRKIPGWLLPALGYTLSAVSLIWVFRGFNLQQTLADLESLDWRFVSVAVVFDLSVPRSRLALEYPAATGGA